MSYILIISVWAGGPAIFSQSFKKESTCLMAKEIIEKQFKALNVTGKIESACIKDGI